MKIFQNLSVLGLFYDVVGVIVLGLPSFIESSHDIYRESLAKTKFDISAGSLFLVAGFLFQLLGTLPMHLPRWLIVLFWVLLFVLPFAYYLWWREMLVRKYVSSGHGS